MEEQSVQSSPINKNLDITEERLSKGFSTTRSRRAYEKHIPIGAIVHSMKMKSACGFR